MRSAAFWNYYHDYMVPSSKSNAYLVNSGVLQLLSVPRLALHFPGRINGGVKRVIPHV